MTDPRIRPVVWHDLIDIIFVAVCAVVAGSQSWEDLPRFGEAKLDWLRKFVRLKNGVPSADTFARVFQRLDPDEFIACLSSWVEAVRQGVKQKTGEEFVAIDGKTMRGSGDAFNGSRPLHLVRAWASENRLVLGQEACEEKSNEITAIPRLLKLIEISAAIVTIDAMGCQTEIAAAIRERDADYILSVKENQPTLHRQIAAAFNEELFKQLDDGDKPLFRECTTKDKAHGREEERHYFLMEATEDMKRSGRWRDLKSIGMVVRLRNQNGEEDVQTHYFVTSLKPEVKRFARAVRSHWSIENRLHWMLDVEFAEDGGRIRKGNSPEIASMLRQLALMILQQDTRVKEKTIRGKRKIAGWNNEALESLVLGSKTL